MVLCLFTGASIGCAVAPNITVLLVCRCIQGLSASGCWSVAAAVSVQD
jgi:predicted MFS family arabinose efflux permease